ncbi:pectinesterase family protein [Paenibacillus sp. 32352]|uniref:pectinesterase family protein n=1 Tax=Paenibacillus sp. 32352 TaxID=1969111 RepID=UPI0009ACE626|nr:pectinesterase family protein [Paenibacillus sp. 32352]
MKHALRVGLCLLLSLNLMPISFFTGPSEALAAVQAVPPLEQPKALQAIPGNNKVALSWDAVPGAAAYQVKRSTVNGGPYDIIQSNYTATSFTDLTVKNGLVYFYVVTATNGSAESMISNQVKASPYAPIAGAPEPPGDFAATAYNGSVELSWSKVTGAVGYSLKRSSTSGGPYTTIAANLTSPTFKDKVIEGDASSIRNGETYYYIVTASNDKGESQPAKEIAVSPAKVISVAQDGSGDFTNVKDAIASIDPKNTKRTVVFIKKGTYTENVVITPPYVSLVGEGTGQSKITSNKSNATNPNQAISAATVIVQGDHFSATNLTIENSAKPSDGQAVALAVQADQAVLENVQLLGYQDTLYAGIRAESPRIGRQYYRNSTIVGRTDFIYGPASAAVFDHVDAVSINKSDSGGVLTAAATKNETDPGLVFINSRLLKDSSTQGKHFLGRPWQDKPIVRFINTYMDDHIDPAGWTTMQVDPYSFTEYNSSGPGASPATRVMGTQMSAQEASELTIPRMFDGWDPTQSVIIPGMFPDLKAFAAPAMPDGQNGAYTKPVLIYLEQNGELPEEGRVQYRVNEGEWKAYAAEFEVGGQGDNVIQYRYFDKAGNASAVQSIRVTVDPNAVARVPAFPGAEGAAMYAKGGRGGQVYEVTTLEDYDTKAGEAPIPGSLRDAVSAGNRTVVFRVSGTIHLKRELDITVGNITIAGQTAPGDGIAVSGYMVKFGNNNVGTDQIIRYIRFRNGINVLSDTADITGNNIIIDHCSFSWSSDETFSVKNRKNFTVQWSIISDSLNLSIHGKGAHGYGGIWGGTNATYHHNLLASHNSRNPRFDRQTDPDNYPTKIDYRNNVVYNWGNNSAYGGEQAVGINMINNYYKPGPSTFDGVKSRIVAPSGEANSGTWYIDGNVVEGAPDVSANNWVTNSQGQWKAINPQGPIVRKYKPILIPDATDPIGGPVTTDTAEAAYEKVLESAGASLPKRDSLDARIVDDVRNGTGRIINTIQSDGGLPELLPAAPPLDSDHDGIPDDWEVAHGLNPANGSDGAGLDANGYTYLENYINSLVVPVTPNPIVQTTGIRMHQAFKEGDIITLGAEASAESGVAQVIFYSGSQEIGRVQNAPFTLEWKQAPKGEHYIYSKAIDNTGRMTLSSVIIIYVNGAGEITPWVSSDIGSVTIEGSASQVGNDFSVKGAGVIGGSTDSFHYTYQPVEGNFEMIAYVDFDSEIDDLTKSGLMVRASLADNAPAAAIFLTPDTDENAPTGRKALFMNRLAAGAKYSSKAAASSSLKAPFWLKLVRTDNTITGYVSTDRVNWGIVNSAVLELEDQAYIGMAVDAPKSTSNSDYLAAAKFNDVQLHRSAKFLLHNPSTAAVEIPSYTVEGTMVDGANLDISLNGTTVIQSVYHEAGSLFSHDLQLTEGLNTITISVHSEASGDVINSKTISVTYNKSAIVFQPTSTVPAVVHVPAYELSVTANRGAAAVVSLNGSVLMENVTITPGIPLHIPLTLQEGANDIVITGKDEYGNTGTSTFRMTYNPNWGSGMFTIQKTELHDLGGNLIYSLNGVRDVMVKATLASNSKVSQNGVVVIALFDSQDRMTRYALTEQTISGGATTQASALLRLPENVSEGYKLKVFVWDQTSSRNVISNVVSIP